jgi:Uma2 family endonuclease
VLLDPDDQDAILNPSLVVEVLSASTEAFDRGDKFLGYRSLESLTDYLLISQTVAQVEHYARSNKAEWVLRTYGPMDTIDVRSLGWAPRVRDLYEGVLDTGDP